MFEIDIPADPGALSGMRRRLLGWLNEAGVGEPIAGEVILAVGEAVANAIEHAYPQHTADGVVTITAEMDAQQLEVSVQDSGAWHDTAEPDPTRGRGFTIMEALMRQIHVHATDSGTRVHMLRDLDKELA